MKVIKLEITPKMKNECVDYYVNKIKVEDNKFSKNMLEEQLEELKKYLSPLDEITVFNNLDDFSKLRNLQWLIRIPSIYKEVRKLYLYTRNHLVQIPNGFKYKLSKYEKLVFDASINCHLVFEKITDTFEYVYIEPTIKDCEKILKTIDEVVMYDYEISCKVIFFRKEVYKLMKRLAREYIRDNR